jgi:acetolactate synthase-1/2/3 large subunit
MDFIVDQKETVFPMIPAGAGHNEMILGGRDAMVSKDEEGMVLV